MSGSRAASRALLVLLLAGTLTASGVTSVSAAGPSRDVCHDPAPAKALPPDKGAGVPLDPAVVAAAARFKETAPDLERAYRLSFAETERVAAASLAKKIAMSARGQGQGASVTILSDHSTLVRECLQPKASANLVSLLGRLDRTPVALATTYEYLWINWLNQQGQQTSYWCGPATVSEMATTEANNGRLSNPVSQATAASYMGTTTDGTTVNAMVSGLGQYVGTPVVGWNWYSFVWVTTSPTATEKANYLERLDFDLQHGFPVAGDAWEAAYGPHLLNHPTNLTIFHWFQIGGYNSYGANTYYIDSATTVWPAVQATNWLSTDTIMAVLGGRGYAW